MTKRRLASYGLNLVGVALLYAAITLAFTFNAFGKSTTYIQGICTTACYTIIMVTSLNLVVGFMGEFSMGHAGFVSVGAYVSAIVSGALAGHGLSDLALLLVAILAGGLAAGLMGIAVGIPALRLRGDYLAIVTMAFAEIIRVCFCNFSITGDGKTMSGILKLSTFDRAFWIMVVCVTVMFLFVRSRFGRTVFEKSRADALDRALTRLCEPLEIWLDEHRDPDETHEALLQLYFDIRAWLRVADTFDDHFVLQIAAHGSEVRAAMLCLDPSDFLAADFAKGRAAVLFSATLAPAGYYRDLCGLPDARAVALRSPFDTEHLGLWCARHVSTRYKDRADSIAKVADLLAVMSGARVGHYLAFFPSYSYLQQVWEDFTARYPDQPTLCQESAMDEGKRAEFLAQFQKSDGRPLLGFAVLGGVFGEGVDLTGESLIGAAIVSPGLPQVGPRQEQLRDYFEQTRGSGFDYAYRFPGMNKVLQAAGRVIRTPEDRGVVLLIDDRFLAPDTRRLMPPHWEHLKTVDSAQALTAELAAFWK